MIYGIGVDIVAVARIRKLLERHGEAALERILSPLEQDDFRNRTRPERDLANRWAAKEAFSKALGTGLRSPVTLTSIALTHDNLGKPGFAFSPELQHHLDAKGITAAHLSLSDEAEYTIAYVILETA